MAREFQYRCGDFGQRTAISVLLYFTYFYFDLKKSVSLDIIAEITDKLVFPVYLLTHSSKFVLYFPRYGILKCLKQLQWPSRFSQRTKFEDCLANSPFPQIWRAHYLKMGHIMSLITPICLNNANTWYRLRVYKISRLNFSHSRDTKEDPKTWKWGWLLVIYSHSQSQSQWGICIAPLTILDSGAKHVES